MTTRRRWRSPSKSPGTLRLERREPERLPPRWRRSWQRGGPRRDAVVFPVRKSTAWHLPSSTRISRVSDERRNAVNVLIVCYAHGTSSVPRCWLAQPRASLFFSASLRSSPFDAHGPGSGGFSVAVVRLVVERQDLLHAHQFGHDAMQHTGLRFRGSEAREPFLAPCRSARPPTTAPSNRVA